ncbi:MAG: iron-containing alcohol dehydrogenase [Lachnospiraceae bacterium]|nr:iron-containing alcohol dehydrogenase [Lachnospiraceae bacterium]
MMIQQGTIYPSDFEAKKAILEAAAAMEEKGYVVGPDGSLSVRVGQNAIWITVKDADKRTLTQDQLIRVDQDGRPALGRDLRPLPEDLPVHLKVYAANKEIKAILHGYPLYTVLAGLSGRELPAASFAPSVRSLGKIPCLPEASPEELAGLSAGLCLSSKGMIVKNDGCVMWGSSIQEALQSMTALEKLAEAVSSGPALPGNAAVAAKEGSAAPAPANRQAHRLNSVKTSFFGKGAIRLLPEELKKMGIKRALIVTDAFLHESGVAEKVGMALRSADVEYAVYHRVTPNPTTEVVNECLSAVRELSAELLVAVGGGSATDTAKAVSIVAANGGRVEDYEGVNRSAKPGIPIVSVNTTAGTGSECTVFYIVTDPVRRSKMAMVDPNCMVGIAVNDIDFMMSMPPSLTAATGMDALTHAVEALFAKGANPLTDKDALWAIRTVYEFLPRAVRNGQDEEARTMMAYAEYVAGMAFSNAGLGMVHAMAHALGGHYNLPHGVCNAILLPFVMEFDKANPGLSPRFEKIAEAYRLSPRPGEAAEEVIRATRELSRQIKIPASLKELGKVKPEEFGELSGLALKDASMSQNYFTPSAEEVIRVYAEAYEGVSL